MHVPYHWVSSGWEDLLTPNLQPGQGRGTVKIPPLPVWGLKGVRDNWGSEQRGFPNKNKRPQTLFELKSDGFRSIFVCTLCSPQWRWPWLRIFKNSWFNLIINLSFLNRSKFLQSSIGNKGRILLYFFIYEFMSVIDNCITQI